MNVLEITLSPDKLFDYILTSYACLFAKYLSHPQYYIHRKFQQPGSTAAKSGALTKITAATEREVLEVLGITVISSVNCEQTQMLHL